MPGILPALLFALRFHSCVVCAGEHGVYFENNPSRALTLTLSHTPQTEWERGPEVLPRKPSSAGPKPFGRPKALRPVSTVALGRSSRRIFILRGTL